jgi:hypothetical protein
MKISPTIVLQRQHELLVRHGASGTLASLDDVLESLKPNWCHKLVPVLVPRLADGQAYRRLITDVHADLTKKEMTVDQVSDDAFHPGNAYGVRFTIDEYHWRKQAETIAQLRNGGEVIGLSLFANMLYLLDMCAAHDVPDVVAHPMWSHTVSHQAAVAYPRTSKLPTLFIRSESETKHQRTVFSRLVVAEQMCRESLAPFYLPDLRMP